MITDPYRFYPELQKKSSLHNQLKFMASLEIIIVFA